MITCSSKRFAVLLVLLIAAPKQAAGQLARPLPYPTFRYDDHLDLSIGSIGATVLDASTGLMYVAEAGPGTQLGMLELDTATFTLAQTASLTPGNSGGVTRMLVDPGKKLYVAVNTETTMSELYQFALPIPSPADPIGGLNPTQHQGLTDGTIDTDLQRGYFVFETGPAQTEPRPELAEVDLASWTINRTIELDGLRGASMRPKSPVTIARFADTNELYCGQTGTDEFAKRLAVVHQGPPVYEALDAEGIGNPYISIRSVRPGKDFLYAVVESPPALCKLQIRPLFAVINCVDFGEAGDPAPTSVCLDPRTGFGYVTMPSSVVHKLQLTAGATVNSTGLMEVLQTLTLPSDAVEGDLVDCVISEQYGELYITTTAGEVVKLLIGGPLNSSLLAIWIGAMLVAFPLLGMILHLGLRLLVQIYIAAVITVPPGMRSRRANMPRHGDRVQVTGEGSRRVVRAKPHGGSAGSRGGGSSGSRRAVKGGSKRKAGGDTETGADMNYFLAEGADPY